MTVQIISRKMGFVEKFCALTHDGMNGALSVATKLEIAKPIEFKTFKQACNILFERQPMLRVVQQIKDNEYYFSFTATFSDIPIKHISIYNDAIVNQEYGKDILKKFDTSHYFWRCTLFSNPDSLASYIIFAAPHTTVDVISISHLMVELLNIITQLESGIVPHATSRPIPLSMDDILDTTKFILPKQSLSDTSTPSITGFPNPATRLHSENLLKEIDESTTIKIMANCKQHGVTLTNAIAAALALSTVKFNKLSDNNLDLFTAINLRPYTKQHTPADLLSFYAHQVLYSLNIADNQNIWCLAKIAHINLKQKIKEYSIPKLDVAQLVCDIQTLHKQKNDAQAFPFTYAVSNVGPVDKTFATVDQEFRVKSFCFTVTHTGLHPLILFINSFKNKLCINFNYSAPAFDQELVNIIANQMVTCLLKV